MSRNLKHIAGSFAIVAIAVTFSYYFLDAKIALYVYGAMKKSRLVIYSSDIPDLLFPIVCVITVSVWMAYFHLVRKGVFNRHTRFFQIVAISVPLSFTIKLFLKHAFGRVNTRLWLHNHKLYGFHWFHGGGGLDGFPSGHMAVFAALIAALWRYYPEHRHIYFAFLSMLAAALIVTDYHFLSDVIAGTYLGVLIVFCIDHGVKFWRSTGKYGAPGPEGKDVE